MNTPRTFRKALLSGLWLHATAIVVLGQTAPQIVAGPENQVVPLGGAAGFTVSATGSAPLSYQWSFNGTNLVNDGRISGATETSLTISNVAASDSGLYAVVVSNSAGTATSSNAFLNVLCGCSLAEAVNATNLFWETGSGYGDPWSYETNSTHDGIAAAQSGFIWWSDSWIQTTVTGPIAVSFWWRASFHSGDHLRFEIDTKELASISGNTGWENHGFCIPAGNHQVRWRFTKDQPFGMYDMRGYLDEVTLSAPTPLVVTSSPSSQTVNAGSDVTFSGMVSGLEPIAYQWQRYGTNLPGATNSTLPLGNVQAWDAGDFALVAENCSGAITSQVATLTVVAAAPWVTQAPASQTGYLGVPVTFTAAARGTEPLGYQWQFNGTNLDGASDTSLALSNPQYASAGQYAVVVTNSEGAVTSSPAVLTIKNPRPAIVVQPVDREVWLGSNTTLSVQADGYALTYQWKLNGTNLRSGQFISGATGPTLSLGWVGTNYVGSYYVAISNGYGNATSSKVSVSGKQVVAWGAGTNYGASPQLGQAIVPAGLDDVVAMAGGRYHSLALKSDGTVVAWGAGTNYGSAQSPDHGQSIVPDGLSNVVAIAGGGYHSLALEADGTVMAWGAGTNASLYTGMDYQQSIVPSGLVGVKAVAAGAFHSLALKNDGSIVAWGFNGSGQTNVTPGLSNVVAIAAGYSHSAALRSDGTVVVWGASPDPYGLKNIPFTVYNVVAIASGDNHMVALRGDGSVFSWGKNNGGGPATDFVTVAAGGDHSVGVRTNGIIVAWGDYSYGMSTVPGVPSASGVAAGYQHNLAWLGDGSPVIKIPPVSRSVYAGQTTNLTVLAIIGKSMPKGYQWQFKGTNIVGATQPTLTLSSLALSNAGAYRVVVSNRYAFATSAPAMLQVSTAVASTNFNQILSTTGWLWISSSPFPWFGQTNVTMNGLAAQSGPIGDGQQSILETTVTGPGTVGFYWRVSSEEWFDLLDFAISGASQASISGSSYYWQPAIFAVPPGPQTLQWRYTKDISLSAGLDAGFLARVSFQPGAPVILAQPMSQTARMGDNAQFQVTATGTGPLSYQWRRQGTILPGATSPELLLTNLARADAGTYAVTVTNFAGPTTSSNALLTVQVPQRIVSATMLPGGGLQFLSGYADGWPLQAGDLGNFEFQSSSNLLDWVALTNVPVLTNGQWLLQDPSPDAPARFYRVLEH